MSTELEQVKTAVAEIDRVAAGLAELKQQFAGVVYDVKTAKGMEEAKAARAAIRKPRYEIELIRKNAKAPILALGRKLDSEAARITAEIMTIEDPVDKQIKGEETRREIERIEKANAELARVEALNLRIDAIREMPIDASGLTSAHARQVLAIAEAMQIGPEFEERKEEAKAALFTAIASIKGVVAEREKHEAEQEKLKAERAELEVLRAAHAKREAEERARIVEEERKAKTERDAEAARQAAELKQQREEQAALAYAERQRIADEEAAAKAFRDAEAKKLAAERAEFERQQAEAAKIREVEERARREQARLASIQKPANEELIGVLAGHYAVPPSKVVEWLTAIDFSTLELAA